MKAVFVSDVTLKQIAKRREEISLCDRKKLVSMLSGLGIDSIELPAMKYLQEDVIANRIIAEQAENCEVCIPVGYTEESVKAAWNSVSACEKVRLQVEYPISAVQLEYMFRQKSAQALESIAALISMAKAECDKVELVAGDATRADRSVIEQICATAEEKGASVLTICDDTEAILPGELADLVSFVRQHWKKLLYVRVSDRAGLGVSSAMAAISAGADGIKTSIYGDDALPLSGLANLIHLRGESLGFASRLNVTAAGQTVAAILKQTKPALAERPSEKESDTICLSANSSISEIADAVASLGYVLSDEDCGKVRSELLRVTAKKDAIGERELEAIIAGAAMAVPSTYHVESYVINSGNLMSSTAQIALNKNGERFSGVSIGDGPIDAAFHAIEQIIGHHYELEDFQIQSITQGREALGNALVKLRANGKLYSGNGVSTDIVGASIRAYVNALNKIVYEEN